MRVHVNKERDDPLLSRAFHHPHLCAGESQFAQNYMSFAVEPLHDIQVRQEVLLIRRRSNKSMIAWLLVLLLSVSPAMGTLIGTYTRRADVGVAVSAGIFALASFLQGLAVWLQI